eukprot:jgi/Mesen1/7866/ME000042S07316
MIKTPQLLTGKVQEDLTERLHARHIFKLKIKPEIIRRDNLKSLLLSTNRVEELPDEIGQLSILASS